MSLTTYGVAVPHHRCYYCLHKYEEHEIDSDDRPGQCTASCACPQYRAEIPNDFDGVTFCCNVILKEAREETRITKQIVYTMLSAYTNNPINLAINAPTGTGKSYAITKASALFPKMDVMLLAGMTDKAIFHRQGTLVRQNEETGEYEDIQPEIDKLNTDIEAVEDSLISATKEQKVLLRKQKADLEKEKGALLKNAKKLIDLSHKIMIFLDTPRPNLFAAIMPLLSHDAWEVEYDFVDTFAGIRTKSNILRGWPAVIFLQAIDSSHHERWPEIQRRFIITNPMQTQSKIEAAIDLTADKYGLPDALYQLMVVSDQDKDAARRTISELKETLMTVSKNCKPGKNNVFIPFRKSISAAMPSTQATDMTTANKFFTWLSLMALIRVKIRPHLVLAESDAVIPIATFADLKETLSLTEYTNGTRPYVLEWFNDVFSKGYDAILKANRSTFDSLLPEEQEKKKRKADSGVTSKELAKWIRANLKKAQSAKYIREQYLKPLSNGGYLEEEENPDDKREMLYVPIVEKESKLFGSKILIKDAATYPSKENLIKWILDDVGIENDDTVMQLFDDPGSCFELVSSQTLDPLVPS